MGQDHLSRRDIMGAATLALAAALPGRRLLAQGSQSVAPVYAPPRISAPLPDPLRAGLRIHDVSPMDYVAEERLMSGIAPIYKPVHEGDMTVKAPPAGTPPSPMGGVASGPPAEGPGVPVYDPMDSSPRPILSTAPYTARIIIYRPRDMRRFSGNVILEAMHPNGGGSMPMWETLSRFFGSRGDVFIGVQHPRNYAWLKYHAPGRYDTLSSPDFSQLWGMLSDVARLVKTGGGGSPIPVKARRVYMTGYSFSGLLCTTYAKQHHAVNRLPDGAALIDGYPIGTGFGPFPPLDAPVMIGANQYAAYNDTDKQPLGITSPSQQSRPVREASNADGPMARLRRYEIAGFPHTPLAPAEPGGAIPLPQRTGLDPRCFYQAPLGAVANLNALCRPIYEGMFQNMSEWVDKGVAPPRAPLIETQAGKPVLDDYGNVRGGVRMPEITLPLGVVGAGVKECQLNGWVTPFPAPRLRQLYGDWAGYLQKYNAATDKMVADRFILPERGAQMKLEMARSMPDF